MNYNPSRLQKQATEVNSANIIIAYYVFLNLIVFGKWIKFIKNLKMRKRTGNREILFPDDQLLWEVVSVKVYFKLAIGSLYG